MSTKMFNKTTGTFQPAGDLVFMFQCDRCGNTSPFFNGMTVYRLEDRSDKREFCSEICVRNEIQAVQS